MSTPEEAMYEEALSAIHAGERSRARDLLARLLKIRKDEAMYWVWMSAVVDTSKERGYCLKEALRLDPQNAVAQRGLVLMGAAPPVSSQILPGKLQKRNWQSKMILPEAELASRKPVPKSQFALMGTAAVVLIGLVAFAIYGVRDQLPTRRYARPVLIFPTDTLLAVLGEEITATAALDQNGTPLPFEKLLKETYTPTPLYVNTPHSISEAYRIGLRSFQRGEWEKAQDYFTQVLDLDSDAVDVRYYLGETFRQQGNLSKALEVFNETIDQNAGFAPSYLGRARVRLAQNPQKLDVVEQDLHQALEKDPKLGEAYLTLADVQVQSGDAKEALNSLEQAASLMPYSPLVYLYHAQAYLAMKDTSKALENARQANQMDVTLLPAYRMIGETLQAQKDWKGSLEPLKTYLNYTPEDGKAWAWLAKAQYETGDEQNALKSLNQSLRLDSRQYDGLLMRAQLYLNDKNAEDALDDYQSALRLNPESFEASMGMARALMDLKYPGDAYQKIEESKKLAESEAQKAEWLFWRARSLDALGEFAIALRDYQSFIDLPQGVTEPAWVAFARERVAALVTSTPTPRHKTATPAPSSTRTRQPTATKTSTRIPTRTP